MEVAASCREEGLEVIVLELMDLPLVRAFGREVGKLYGEFHRQRGVDLRCGVGVASLRGSGRVEEVVTTTGETIPCDFVVAGIGVVPATGWLEGSGVTLDRGVVVNERCETSLPGVYAAGDVARFFHPRYGRHVMVEAVENAQLMAATAVSNLMGKSEVHSPVAWFWSDQFDLKLQSVGVVDEHDRVVYRGSIETKQFAAFLLKGDRVTGVIGVNRLKEIAAAKKLISASIPVKDEMLADPEIAMSKILAPT